MSLLGRHYKIISLRGALDVDFCHSEVPNYRFARLYFLVPHSGLERALGRAHNIHVEKLVRSVVVARAYP